MSISTKIRAHQIRMDRIDRHLEHNTSSYRRTNIQELGNQITLNLANRFSKLTAEDRRALLSLANLEITDCHFRRLLRLALQS